MYDPKRPAFGRAFLFVPWHNIFAGCFSGRPFSGAAGEDNAAIVYGEMGPWQPDWG